MIASRHPIVIIGIGDALRRDDGVGPLVLDACRYEPVPGCDLAELDGDPTSVVDAWSDRDTAIVVDAVCVGAVAGTLHETTISPLEPSMISAIKTEACFAGLSEALSLGERSGRLPRTLHVLGIEPGDLKPGFGLSAPVAAAMDALEARVRAAVAIARTGTASDDGTSSQRGPNTPGGS